MGGDPVEALGVRDDHLGIRILDAKDEFRAGPPGVHPDHGDPDTGAGPIREQPLGIIISDGKLTNRMHRGGSLLTGVFYLQKDKPQIVHRSQFIPANNVRLALQAGPRLVEAGKPLQLKSPNAISRRSGIAVTKDGEIVMFATILRFPGASLQQIQDMLLDPRLAITDALNLDGGGSSQLFVRKNSALPEETFITGGDVVPVGLVVRRKKEIK